MLHIFLLILKILLITVLILIGLVLVLLLLLLFVPVRYRFYAEKHDNFICKLKASWLGFVFCFKANYDENGFVYWLRSFGGTLVSNEDGFSEESQEETDTETEVAESEKETRMREKAEVREAKKLKKQEKAETRKAKKQEKREQAEVEKAKKTEKQEAEDAESDQQDGLSDIRSIFRFLHRNPGNIFYRIPILRTLILYILITDLHRFVRLLCRITQPGNRIIFPIDLYCMILLFFRSKLTHIICMNRCICLSCTGSIGIVQAVPGKKRAR